VAVLASLATAAALLVVTPSAQATGPHDAPPPNPSDSQLHNAAALKSQLADQVGNLSAKIASLQTQLIQLQGNAELAEQKFAFAAQKLQQAKDASTLATKNAATAQQNVNVAQQQFVMYAQASYMSGDVAGTTGTLLSADDPNVLLQQGALDRYQSSHQINAIGSLQRATVAKSNADAAARRAVNAQTAATQAADQARQAAEALVAQTKTLTQQVQQAQASTQLQLNAARNRLLTLTGQRAKYNAYVRYQAWLAYKRRQAEIKKQQEEAAAAAARARERARERAKHHHSSDGGGGGGSSSNGGGAPIGGGWTPARGQQAANRALDWLGEIYIWAGGNNWGPTDGGCTDPVSPCGTLGFDCSGLAMYAWGPYLYMDHFAASQYSQAGSYHPSPGNFLPGDLLFWSNGGGQSSIHHVAIYIGNGDVVEAPDSGLHVRIRPWTSIPSTFYGATRPLT
jgi:cell wall-associated NlpC family hydrolase